jgi:hypothetical protein
VLAALVASLRRELADTLAVVEEIRAELGRARERIAKLEARLRQNPRNSSKPPPFPHRIDYCRFIRQRKVSKAASRDVR